MTESIADLADLATYHLIYQFVLMIWKIQKIFALIHNIKLETSSNTSLWTFNPLSQTGTLSSDIFFT